MPLPREELYGMFYKGKGMSSHMPMGGLMKKNQLDPLTEHHYQTIADGNFVQRNKPLGWRIGSDSRERKVGINWFYQNKVLTGINMGTRNIGENNFTNNLRSSMNLLVTSNNGQYYMTSILV